jgi:hypothetical protein
VTDGFESALDGLDSGRRVFLRRLVAGSSYAEPTVSSFTMADVSTAYAGVIASIGPNQTVEL